jgi:hypothetical protein
MAGDAVNGSKRLMVVATGNISGGMMGEVMTSQPLEDPSQSWSALTIGGFTQGAAARAAPGFEPGCAGQSSKPIQPRLTGAPRRPYADQA